ncbi:hypothetical protein Tco_0377897, partial [Tanacetum coccineum]
MRASSIKKPESKYRVDDLMNEQAGALANLVADDKYSMEASALLALLVIILLKTLSANLQTRTGQLLPQQQGSKPLKEEYHWELHNKEYMQEQAVKEATSKLTQEETQAKETLKK